MDRFDKWSIVNNYICTIKTTDNKELGFKTFLVILEMLYKQLQKIKECTEEKNTKNW
jgi:hypothetical protein